MGITGEHDDALYVVATYFIFDYFIGSFLSLLDKSMTTDDNELFPLGMMPVLAFDNPRFGDIDADLSAVNGMDKLSE